MDGSHDLDISNARVVTPDAIVDGGAIVRGGVIEAVRPARGGMVSGAGGSGGAGDPGGAGAEALDFSGDYLIPGVVDLHTDHVERHVVPRSTVVWDFHQALAAHDAVIVSGGTTTVYDSLAVGATMRNPARREILGPLLEAIRLGVAEERFRAEHLVHLRCEICDPATIALVDAEMQGPLTRLASVMDHTPGDRQSPDVEDWLRRNARDMQISLDEARERLAELLQRSARWGAEVRAHVVAAAHRAGAPLMSHDDRSAQHVRQAQAEGVTISEFPTTLEAAREARRLGLAIVAGAPNYVRGGSQSGNVAVAALLAEGLVDALASDYIPRSPLECAFALAADPALGFSLPAAMALVSRNPAALAGLRDRGAVVPGLRADLVRVRLSGDRRHVVSVWRAGRRVF